MAIGGLNIQNVGDGVSMATLIHIKSGAGDGATHDNIVFKKATMETFSVDVNGLNATTSGDMYQYAVAWIGDVAADSDTITPVVFYSLASITLSSIGISVDTDVTDDNVNYQTIQFTDKDGNNILAAGFTTDIEWTAGKIESAGALVSGSHEVLAAADYVKMTFTKTASGKAFSGMTVHIAYQYTS